MIARMLSARSSRRRVFAAGPWALACALLAAAGCSSTGPSQHDINKIPQPGIIDPHQPRELQMVSFPPYVVEPPDELEITVRPAVPELAEGAMTSVSTLTVQTDGTIDMGFLGSVYVSGLDLEQIELKLAQILSARPGRRPKEPYQVSARLVNGSQSKSYYVLGTVSTQGKFPCTGNETVLDAIITAGLKVNSVPEKAYLVRPHPAGAGCQILKIDWVGIRDRGDTLTNYQIFPGDRIIVPGGKPPGLLRSLVGG